MDSFSQMTQEQKQLRQHLSTLQHWKAEKNASPDWLRESHLMNIKRHQNEYNVKFAKKVQENIPAAKASSAAAGITAQSEIAAKESFKEKQERKKKDKAAKKRHPDANHTSFDIVDSLKFYDKHYNNSFSALPSTVKEKCTKNGVNTEILRVFSMGHYVDKQGQPDGDDSLQAKNRDLAFYSDYSSGNLEQRIPHLERMAKQILDSPLSPDLFTESVMKTDAGMIQNQIERLKLFSEVMQDPINRPYFRNLPDEIRGPLYIQLRTASDYETTFQAYLGSYAIDQSKKDYFTFIKNRSTNVRASSFSPNIKSLKDKISKTTREKYETIKQAYADKMITESDQRKKLYDDTKAEWANLNLTSYANDYAINALAECRTLIEKNPQLYAKNAALIDKIYQDAYRSVDIMGDYTLRCQSAAVAVNSFSSKMYDQLSYEQKHFLSFSDKDSDEANKEIEILQNQIRTCTDSLAYLLNQSKLSNAASFYLEKKGYSIK